MSDDQKEDSSGWQKLFSAEFTKAFNEAIEHEKDLSESFWNSLSSEERLWVFCAVVRRIHQGEIEDPRSYRGVLYDIFDFGPESYASAQCSGYLDIHNSIYNIEDLTRLVCDVIKELGSEFDTKTLEEIIIRKKYY